MFVYHNWISQEKTVACLQYHPLSWPVNDTNYYTRMAKDHKARLFGGQDSSPDFESSSRSSGAHPVAY